VQAENTENTEKELSPQRNTKVHEGKDKEKIGTRTCTSGAAHVYLPSSAGREHREHRENREQRKNFHHEGTLRCTKDKTRKNDCH
jgi:hypothetical protein